MPNAPQPPVQPPNWSALTPERIPTLTDETLRDYDAFLDTLAALPASERTFHSVAESIALRSAEVDRTLEPALFLQYVATDAAVRDASVEADKRVQAWQVDMIGREDVYEALLDAQKHVESHGVRLNPEEKRLLDRMVLERKRNGLGLDKTKRAHFQKVCKSAQVRSGSRALT